MTNTMLDPNAFDRLVQAIETLTARLAAFERAQQSQEATFKAQQALNDQFHNEFKSLRSAFAEFQRSFVPASPASVTSPAPAASTPATQPAPSQPGQQSQQSRPKPPQWTKILQRPAAETNKRRRQHALRALQPPRPVTEDPAYTVLHLYRSHRMNHAQYRATLHAVGIDSSRILDVSFPARNVSTILIHVEYKAAIVQLLEEGGINQVPNFNPLDHQHVADPAYLEMAPPQRARIAAALHTDRCIRTVRFVKPHTVPSVLKFFTSQNWIPLVTAKALSEELLPRPAKRTIDPRSTMGQLLMQPEYANQLPPSTVRDLYGNSVPPTDIEMGEEFHDNAAGSESESDDNSQ